MLCYNVQMTESHHTIISKGRSADEFSSPIASNFLPGNGCPRPSSDARRGTDGGSSWRLAPLRRHRRDRQKARRGSAADSAEPRGQLVPLLTRSTSDDPAG